MSQHLIEVFTGGEDLECNCNRDALTFPRVGECAHESDAIVCYDCPTIAFVNSCLSTVRLDSGTEVVAEGQSGGASGPPLVSADWISSTDVSLALAGCGAGEFKIPVSASELPRPSVSYAFDANQHLVVQWSTDVPAASALVSAASTFSRTRCHTSASTYVFDSGPASSAQTTSVLAFAPPTTQETPLGTARVWRGYQVSLDVQP